MTFYEDKETDFEIKVTKIAPTKEVVIENNKETLNIKKEASQSNKTLVKNLLQRVSKLDKDKRKNILEKAIKYNPSDSVKKWAENVFENTNNNYSKLCMYLLENKS